jgi:hypothetical protein
MENIIILYVLILVGFTVHFIILTGIDKDVMDIRNELREIHRTIKHKKP